MEVSVKGRAKRKHLNAQDCDKLGQSANSLTKPHTSNQEWSSPNRGHYNRSPRKRHKSAAASATGSPSGKQTAIVNFFSLTKVISSSPNKSSQPSTSTHSEGSVFVEEDEDGDVSLLASQCELVDEEEDEIDDESLLSAETQSKFEADGCVFGDAGHSGAGVGSELKEEDYLEGLTAEMFGDDEEFDKCCNQDEVEEIEPLPDAHFGLLGDSRVLLQPQGGMDDLPDEVLRQILVHVPAADLYRSTSLVCHRWRNIIQEPTFVPFKKQYYRYMMREKGEVQEVTNLLISSNIKNCSPKEHSLRNLVVLMAQHKIGERVRPESVLECVKKHRFFPQAEASIGLRIPKIQKFHLGIEGPNPYAAMAVILLLSESVGDVQDLVSLLTGCMSLTAITEYLSHMATMLLAIERAAIHISNRLHYNIYYVLHLLENGPFSVSSQIGSPQIQLTREQQQILSHNIQPNHLIKIIAFAGTGKTTTLIKYAEQRPYLQFLYVAFNNSVACEARRRFPSNVDCRTVHSLAYNDIGKIYKFHGKLTSNLKPFSINCALDSGHGGFTKAKVVTTILNTFMSSADPDISPLHVPDYYACQKGFRKAIDSEEKKIFIHDAKMIWSKMKDVEEKSKQAYFMPHDGYLKLWQLSKTSVRLADQYDVIFIDEAQDCTPAIMDVLLSQSCGKILVGDPHQQIYTFKGAVNALKTNNHTHIFYLTQSFRFGAEIAYVGATILRVCKGVEKILVGGKQKGGVCDEVANKALEAMKTGVSQIKGKIGILSRCNLGVFKAAVQLTDANLNCSIHFIGGVNNIGLDKIMDIYTLMTSNGKNINSKAIKDPLVRSFLARKDSPFLAFRKYVDQTEDKELEGKVGIVLTFHTRIPVLVKRLRGCSQSKFDKADFIVGTVHKAKGLEFDTVIISDDFTTVPSSGHNLCHFPEFAFSKIADDEWNLLYVAVTRARTTLVATNNIFRILSVAKEYFLKSQMPITPEGVCDPVPCSIPNCPNCLTPGSAFIMSKQSKQCTDKKTKSGPLCERCVWIRSRPVAYLITDDVTSMAEIPEQFRPPMHHPFFMALFF